MRYRLTTMLLMAVSLGQAQAGSMDDEYVWLPKEHTVCQTFEGLKDSIAEVRFAECGTIPYKMRFQVKEKMGEEDTLLTLVYILVIPAEDGTGIALLEKRTLYSVEPSESNGTPTVSVSSKGTP